MPRRFRLKVQWKPLNLITYDVITVKLGYNKQLGPAKFI